MAANTVKIKVRTPAGPDTYLVQKQWTWTDDLNSGFNVENGIAWDGKLLWFCSDAQSGTGRPSKLLAFDPVQQVQAVPSFAIVGLGATEKALDIVWNQLYGDRWALYMLTKRLVFPTNEYYIYHVNRKGQVFQLGQLPIDAQQLAYRSICFDGLFVYVTQDHRPATADLQRLIKYDIVNLVAVRVGPIAVPNTGTTGWGVVFDGHDFHFHGDVFGFLHVWVGYTRGVASTTLARKKQISAELIGGLDFIGPCTYDRKHIYDFEVT